MHLDEVDTFRTKWNNTGVYKTAYRYSNEKQEGELIGDMYLDFDIANLDIDNFEKIRSDAIRSCAMLIAILGIDAEQLEIYFSGKKGFHIVIPYQIMGIEPHEKLNEIFKVIASDFKNISKHKTVDTKIYDRVRLFRLPNSIHPDTKLYKIPLTMAELRYSSLDQIEALAGSARELERKPPRYNPKAHKQYKAYIEKWLQEEKKLSTRKGETKLDFMPFCVKNILQNEAPEGGRNNTMAALACYFKNRGNSESEAMEKLRRWNEKRCSPMLKDSEIKVTLSSIYKGRYNYGCRTLCELGGCSKDCKMYRR